ncbi:SIR2 family protein [Limosilactobacillus reuteri]|uniref:SIR2 family protein n=1 Tax=Limosilactobacillus reuteri TaxID=1598 RepID=A0A7L6BKM1_LIMRT|nr:SIR2 family protein [Limosilactobacillus reuteri]QLQ62768.1 SIR2 family protein [Limosilactobacillus reuteri]
MNQENYKYYIIKANDLGNIEFTDLVEKESQPETDKIEKSQKKAIWKKVEKLGLQESTADDIKKKIFSFLDEDVNINIMLGSGCSTPAIKLMGQTFLEYRNEKGRKKTRQNEIDNILKDFDQKYKDNEKNIELFISWLGHKIASEKNPGKYQKTRNELLKKLIDSTKKPKSEDDGGSVLKTYREFFRKIAETRLDVSDNNDIINVFTTNYDLFIERSLDAENYQYTNGFTSGIEQKFSIREFHLRKVDVDERYRDKWSPIRPYFRVFKLHGSVNWEKAADEIIQINSYEEIPEDKEIVIAPSDSKYADSQGTPYSDLFREFGNLINKRNSVLFIDGYGFPDEHINHLLLQALKNNDFALVAFINFEELSTNKNLFNFIKKASSNAYFISGTEANANAHYFENIVTLFEPMEENNNE